MDRSPGRRSSWTAAVAILALFSLSTLPPAAGEAAVRGAGDAPAPRAGAGSPQEPRPERPPGPAPDPLPKLPPQPAPGDPEEPPAGTEEPPPAEEPPAEEPPAATPGDAAPPPEGGGAPGQEPTEPPPEPADPGPGAGEGLPAPDPLPADLLDGGLPAAGPAPAAAAGPPSGRVARPAHLPPGPAPPPGSGRLRTRLELAVAGHPEGVLVGDADGDGRAEVIAACRAPGSLHVWSGASAATRPAPPARVTPVGDFPLGPVWLPVDREHPFGRVAVASRSTLELTVHEIDPRAPTGTRLAWSLPLPAAPRAIASGDLGANGTVELVVVTAGDELLIVSADGASTRATLGDSHATCAHVLESGAGVLVGFQESRRVAWFRVAPGPDGPRVMPRDDWELDGPPRRVTEADVDHDGDRELCLVGADRALIVFGLNHRTARDGWLQRDAPPPVRIETGEVPIDVDPVDLAGNGVTELVVLSHSALRLETFGLDDAGELALRTSLYAGQAPWDLDAGDVDGDGAVDLALALPGARRVGLILGEGDGTLRVPPVTALDRGPHAIALGDLDGDARPDALVLSSLRDTRTVLLASAGGLAPHGDPEPAGPGANRPRLADLDGDGHLDAVYLVRGAAGVALQTLFGDGTGRLAPRAATPAVGLGTEIGDLEIADLDGDGRVEAVVSDPADGAVRLCALGGAGEELAWGAPSRTELGGGPRGLATLDLDGGGRRLVLVALAGPGPAAGVAALAARRRPDGGLELELLTAVPAPGAPFDVVAADFDGDGLAEPAVLARRSEHSLEGFVVPWRRVPDGTWTAGEPLVTGLRPYALCAGDLDGDGRADLLVTAQNSHHVNAWLARPAAPTGFRALPDLGAGTGSLDLGLADLDGDWRLDVVVVNAFSDDVTTILQR